MKTYPLPSPPQFCLQKVQHKARIDGCFSFPLAQGNKVVKGRHKKMNLYTQHGCTQSLCLTALCSRTRGVAPSVLEAG